MFVHDVDGSIWNVNLIHDWVWHVNPAQVLSKRKVPFCIVTLLLDTITVCTVFRLMVTAVYCFATSECWGRQSRWGGYWHGPLPPWWTRPEAGDTADLAGLLPGAFLRCLSTPSSFLLSITKKYQKAILIWFQ